MNPSVVKRLVQESEAEVITTRRHLHQHPELSFQEHNTCAYIVSSLQKIGITSILRCADTGVVAKIHCSEPDSKCIALRTDIDALPIQEENDVPYRSQNKGVMHACGHDVHTASLIGAAKILFSLREELKGTVLLIFQPAEEKFPGGALRMLEEGALSDPVPRAVIGQHVLPELNAGMVGFKSGSFMASTDIIFITLKGPGGHAALPHLTVDLTLVASQIITALQSVVSRTNDPLFSSVLTFGSFKSNGSRNVIPSEIVLEGSYRTMNEESRNKGLEKVRAIVEGIARGMGASVDVEIQNGYPLLVNDDHVTDIIRKATEEFIGAQNVTELSQRMTADDFSYFTQRFPGSYYRLGVKHAEQPEPYRLHTSNFNVDESSLSIGVGVLSWMTIRLLQLL